MLKMAKEQEANLNDDPRAISERAVWQRQRMAMELEVIHPDWGTALYALHRAGRLNNDQREAGDRYAALIRDYRKLWIDRVGLIEVYRGPSRSNEPGGHITPDREDFEPEKRSRATADVDYAMAHVLADDLAPESEFTLRRAERIGKRYKEAAAIAGTARSILEDLLINDVWPIGERGRLAINDALIRLFHFFSTGTNRKRQK